MFKLSKPTRKQVVDSVERVILVFVVTAVGAWQLQPDRFSKAALVAAGAVGLTAVYQALKSLTTSL